MYPKEHYEFTHTHQRQTPPGILKPDPTILAKIVDDHGASRDSVAYIGDSLMKDIHMAQSAGVTDVWAKYGVAQSRPEYELLRRVSHWTEEAVQKEKELLREMTIEPTHTLPETFATLLDTFEFVPCEQEGSK